MNIKEVATEYTTIRMAKEVYQRVKPVLEAISTFDKGQKICVKDVGIKMMGEDYTKKVHYGMGNCGWDGRTKEAASLTGVITQAFRKLVELELATRTVVVDKDNPRFYEDEDYRYYDKDGNLLPEVVKVTLANGQEIELPASALPGTTRKWGKVTKIAYPKITYYILK